MDDKRYKKANTLDKGLHWQGFKNLQHMETQTQNRVLKVLVPSLSTLGSLGRHFCAQLGMALPAEAIRAAPSMSWGRPQMAEVIGHVLCSQRSLLPSPGTVLHKINWHTGRFFFCLNSKPSGLALPSFLTATFVCVYRTVVHCLRRTPSRLDVTMTTSAWLRRA